MIVEDRKISNLVGQSPQTGMGSIRRTGVCEFGPLGWYCEAKWVFKRLLDRFHPGRRRVMGFCPGQIAGSSTSRGLGFRHVADPKYRIGRQICGLKHKAILHT